jgi:hypothetical protein
MKGSSGLLPIQKLSPPLLLLFSLWPFKHRRGTSVSSVNSITSVTSVRKQFISDGFLITRQSTKFRLQGEQWNVD